MGCQPGALPGVTNVNNMTTNTMTTTKLPHIADLLDQVRRNQQDGLATLVDGYQAFDAPGDYPGDWMSGPTAARRAAKQLGMECRAFGLSHRPDTMIVPPDVCVHGARVYLGQDLDRPWRLFSA